MPHYFENRTNAERAIKALGNIPDDDSLDALFTLVGIGFDDPDVIAAMANIGSAEPGLLISRFRSGIRSRRLFAARALSTLDTAAAEDALSPVLAGEDLEMVEAACLFGQRRKAYSLLIRALNSRCDNRDFANWMINRSGELGAAAEVWRKRCGYEVWHFPR
jgi:hypothetical protein